MPRDDLISGTESLPEGLNGDIDLFRRDLESSHTVTTTLLSCLSDLLKPATRFEDYHRGNEASQSIMMYFRYAKQSKEKDSSVGHNMHTDLGTLTLLYCEQWGLQVYNQTSNTWAHVLPKPGLYVVNVGDALRFISGNQLLSALHRVVPVPGHETEYRYSTAYSFAQRTRLSSRRVKTLLCLRWIGMIANTTSSRQIMRSRKRTPFSLAELAFKDRRPWEEVRIIPGRNKHCVLTRGE
jgi:2OG-Fe(II) oxygenase superfamily